MFVDAAVPFRSSHASLAGIEPLRVETVRCGLAWWSAPGSSRTRSEDSVLVDVRQGFAALADGAGGFNAGEVASRLAVSALANAIGTESSSTLQATMRVAEQAIERADRSILEAGRSRPECLGLATTLAFARLCGDALVFGHVGDSRIYLLRQGKLVGLTRDHAFERRIADESAPTHPGATPVSRMLTRALGTELGAHADLRSMPVRAGDLVLLCSKGLSDAVPEAAIASCLLECGPDIEAATRRLGAMAVEADAADDVSIIVMRPDIAAQA